MSAEEEETPEPMKTDPKIETVDPPKEPAALPENTTNNNENYVVLDTLAGESEESDKEVSKEEKEDAKDDQDEQASSIKPTPKITNPDPGTEAKPAQSDTKAPATATAAANATKGVRKKPKAPVVDVNSLRSKLKYY